MDKQEAHGRDNSSDDRLNAKQYQIRIGDRHYTFHEPTKRKARQIMADLATFHHDYAHLRTADGETRRDANPGHLLAAHNALCDIVARALDVDYEPIYGNATVEDLERAVTTIGRACKVETRHPDAQPPRRKKKRGRGGKNRRRAGKPG